MKFISIQGGREEGRKGGREEGRKGGRKGGREEGRKGKQCGDFFKFWVND